MEAALLCQRLGVECRMNAVRRTAPTRSRGQDAGTECVGWDLVDDSSWQVEHVARVQRELVDRLAELVAGRYQTRYEDPDEQNCTTLAEYIATHAGFAGPVCH